MTWEEQKNMNFFFHNKRKKKGSYVPNQILKAEND